MRNSLNTLVIKMFYTWSDLKSLQAVKGFKVLANWTASTLALTYCSGMIFASNIIVSLCSVKQMMGPAPHTQLDAELAAGMGMPDNGPRLMSM